MLTNNMFRQKHSDVCALRHPPTINVRLHHKLSHSMLPGGWSMDY